jgi:hypothetical protein
MGAFGNAKAAMFSDNYINLNSKPISAGFAKNVDQIHANR